MKSWMKVTRRAMKNDDGDEFRVLQGKKPMTIMKF